MKKLLSLFLILFILISIPFTVKASSFICEIDKDNPYEFLPCGNDRVITYQNLVVYYYSPYPGFITVSGRLIDTLSNITQLTRAVQVVKAGINKIKVQSVPINLIVYPDKIYSFNNQFIVDEILPIGF